MAMNGDFIAEKMSDDAEFLAALETTSVGENARKCVAGAGSGSQLEVADQVSRTVVTGCSVAFLA
jgi:hypothetical protein